ncbi:hypothetical protein, partial [Pseudomonas sp. 2822-17]|uniref:hypothetical protein n=1 Tax=Pseudomonas sp. 2822-17 TaxID=1712678 RepID=UPI001C4648BD
SYPRITDEVTRRAPSKIVNWLMEKDGIFLDDVEDPDQRDLLANRYLEEAERSLRRSGYRIYTTINKDLYDAHQEVVQNYDQFGPDKNGTIVNDQGEEVTISF